MFGIRQRIWNGLAMYQDMKWVFSALCENFRYCETISKKKFEPIFSCRPARADNYVAD